MPNKPLQATSLTAPGFFGLNTQDSGVGMNQSFALTAYNAVIDKFGRIGARKGWAYKTTSGGTASSPQVVFEMDNNDNTYTIISAGNNKIFTGETTMTEAVVRNATNDANLTYNITDNDWQITRAQYESGLNRSPHAYLVQKGHPTLVYHRLNTTGAGAQVKVTANPGNGHVTGYSATSLGSGYAIGDDLITTGGSGTGLTFEVLTIGASGAISTLDITTTGSGYSTDNIVSLLDTDYHSHENGFGFQRLADVGSVPTGYSASTFTPNCALAAYGRMWFADIGSNNLSIYYSVLLNGSDLSGTGSGVINLEKVVPRSDKIVAMTAHNNFLVVFCQNSIVLYSNANDIGNIALSDVIVGVGCIARDSVQNIGTDVIFLSNAGVRSLARTIQEKSAPIRDISRNVRDVLLGYLSGEDLEKVRSVYYEADAFYLLTLPASKFSFCFDLRQSLEDGSSRATIWNNIDPGGLCATNDRRLLIGKANGIAQYTGYSDNSSSYIFSYFTPYLDFQSPSVIKVLKKIGLTVVGAASTTLDIKWAFDYQSNYQSSMVTTQAASVAEYGIAQYGISEYSATVYIDQIKKQLSGNGNVIQIGINASINGNPLSIQKLDIYAVTGRTI